MNDDYLRIGLVSKPHGVSGALKLQSLTFDNRRFNGLERVFLERLEGEYSPVRVLSVQATDESVIITLEGVTDRNAADKLRGAYLCIPRTEAAPPPEGQYLIVDLIGCTVTDTDGREHGILSEVYSLPANDVYEIKTPDGKKLLIPALKRLLNTVDVANKHILLNADVLAEVGLFPDAE